MELLSPTQNSDGNNDDQKEKWWFVPLEKIGQLDHLHGIQSPKSAAVEPLHAPGLRWGWGSHGLVGSFAAKMSSLKKGPTSNPPQDLQSLFGLTKPRYLNDFAYDSIVLKCWFSSAQTVTPCQRVVTILHGYIPLHSHDIPILPHWIHPSNPRHLQLRTSAIRRQRPSSALSAGFRRMAPAPSPRM